MRARWTALTRCLEDGRLGLDNNPAERALRGVATGRKNYLFAGSDAGGRRAAAMYSLIETAKLNSVNPQTYLADVLARIADHPELRQDLLQEIHVALWRSLAQFDGRCSERTWVYRVAHNVGASHARRRHRMARERLTTLEDLSIATDPFADDPEAVAGDRQPLARLMTLTHALAPIDPPGGASLPRRPRRRRYRRGHGVLRRCRRNQNSPP